MSYRAFDSFAGAGATNKTKCGAEYRRRNGGLNMLKIWKKAIPTVFGLGLLAAPQHAPAQERSLLDEAIAEDIACVVRYGKDPLCVETAKTAVSVCMSGSMLVSNDMDRIRTACNAYIKRKFLEGYVAAGGR